MKVFPAVSATFLLFALQILGIANQVYSISITKGNNDNGSSIKPASSTKKKFQCNTRGYDASKELAFQKKLIALKQSKHHMEDFDDADLTPEVGGMVGSTSSTPRIDTRRHSTGSHSLLFVKRSPMAPLQPPALMLPPTRESHTPPVVRSTARTRQRTQTVRNVVQIDVFFHIFTFEGHGGVSNEVIETQLHFLNSAYAVAKFHFINRGVDHHEIHNEHEFLIGPSSQTKSRLRRGGHNALNVYVAGLDEAILGYSSMLLDDIVSSGAKDDGIVISTATLPGGSLDDFNLGTTLIHETGHWFGLYHTFEGECSFPNDHVEDTVPQRTQIEGCPNHVESLCGITDFHEDHSKSLFTQTSRSILQSGPVEAGNFMDYSDDSCHHHFTRGQLKRMWQIWDIYGGT